MSHKCPYYNDKCPKCMTPTPDTSSVEERIAQLVSNTVGLDIHADIAGNALAWGIQDLIHSEVTAFAERLKEDVMFKEDYLTGDDIDHHLTRYKEGK